MLRADISRLTLSLMLPSREQQLVNNSPETITLKAALH